MPKMNTPYQIEHYSLEQGALEIQYIEEFFSEFPLFFLFIGGKDICMSLS